MRDCRAAAATALAAVLAGDSLAEVLPAQLEQVKERDRALLQQLCYGSLRAWARLDALGQDLLDKPLRNKDRDLRALLVVGLYQLSETRIPDHAAVSSTVAATRDLGKTWARGMLNAVLRRFQREQDNLLAALAPAAGAAHPEWLYRRLLRDWGDAAPAIMAANTARPPMTLRVNRRQGSPADYARRLQAADIACHPGALGPESLYLEQPVDVALLPGFAQGAASVQDEAAQLAAGLLGAEPGERVLDACAAPGGKTCHLLELQPALAELIALDIDAPRLQRVGENLSRLGLAATLLQADAALPPAELEAASFQRILVDAPCSATGVIRRHPDIMLLRREGDIAQLARRQGAILAGLWPLLAPGGTLLYVTCSVLDAENSAVIADFLATTDDAEELPIDGQWGQPRSHGRQLLPAQDGPDGLYFARLVRRR